MTDARFEREDGEVSETDVTAGGATPVRSSGGILLVAGGQLSIPAGGLSLRMSSDGELTAELKDLRVWADMITPWMAVSLEHLRVAKAANHKVGTVAESEEKSVLSQSLHEEMLASMQAIVAGSTALEAFYVAVRDRVALPDALVNRWRSERRRHTGQVVEVLRRAVRLSNRGTMNLSQVVKDVYKFRGLAVHPSDQAQRPVWRDDIGRGVEWRYQAFQFSNAFLLVRGVLAILSQVAALSERATGPSLAKFLAARDAKLKPLVAVWEAEFGTLLPVGPAGK